MLIAKNTHHELHLLPAMANRHGLITGATGTGKTVTLQALAEAFSREGVPVFMADIKGDLSGIGKAGGSHPKVLARVAELGLEDYAPRAFPVSFWDVQGKLGHPIRATISDMGPLLLGRMLNLNDTQQGVLTLIFKIADDQGLLLLDFKDLRAMVQFVGENARQYTTEYGNISAASIGAIQRGLLALDHEGGDALFGEPMLDIHDLMQTVDGAGVVNILAAEQLMQSPKVYATLLLWLLSELYENLPEAGDLAKPKLVFFFDEAHLLFNDAPAVLVDKIEQVVRLIRSKGVGIYFVTQNPADVPEKILGQLGNRIQHALRAFSPRDQKAVRAAAETMRDNPDLDEQSAITELGVGEALISLLDARGTPGIVERAFIVPPASQVGPLTPAERSALMAESLVAGVYEQAVDRESAYEILKGRAAAAQASIQASESDVSGSRDSPSPRGALRQPSMAEALVKGVVGTVGRELGRQLVRGLLGSLLGGGRRR